MRYIPMRIVVLQQHIDLLYTLLNLYIEGVYISCSRGLESIAPESTSGPLLFLLGPMQDKDLTIGNVKDCLDTLVQAAAHSQASTHV